MRLTLRLVALFALISVLSFALTWWLANAALLDSVEQTLEQQIDELRASKDPRQIARAVARLVEHVDEDDLVVRYDGPDGATGNYRAVLPASEDTPRAVFLDDKASDVRGTFYVLSAKVAGGRLTVGRSDDAFVELREVFVKVAAYTLLPTLALVLAVGMVPRVLDLALLRPGVEWTKLAALVAAGAALRLSWRPAGLVLQFFFLGNVLPMMAVVGSLYIESPLRLCNAYLLDDQVRLGQWLIGAAAGVAALWLAWVAWVMVRREARAQLGAPSRAPR